LSWALVVVAVSLVVGSLLARKRQGSSPARFGTGLGIALLTTVLVASLAWPGMVGAQDKSPAEKAAPAAAAKATPAPAPDAKPATTEAKAEAAPAEAKAATPTVKAEQPEGKSAEVNGEAAAPAKAAPPTVQDLRDNRWVKLIVIVAALALPFVLGSYLSSLWRMPDYYGKITLLLLCLSISLAITVMKWPPKLGIDLRGGVILVYEVQEDTSKEAAKKEAGQPDEESKRGRPDDAVQLNMDKLIQAVSRRINPGGVKEVTIRPQGVNQLEIIIPEADEAETARIKSIISRAGTLEFRILANDRDHKSLIERAKASDADKIRDSEGKIQAWWVPVTKGQEKSFASYGEIATREKQIRGKERLEILVVKDPFDVTGDYLSSARTDIDQTGRPKVDFAFNVRGGQLFTQLTKNNLPDDVQDFSRKLGIILDGYLYSAPAIRSTIGDRGEITGDFSKQETEDLVNVLNAGSLPSALSPDPISELFTGPTLGRDTIQSGMNAIFLSSVLVIAFMLVYYRFSGMVACMALLLNMLLLLAAMILIKAAFTLPGLAGLALTIGMAVDANVLIYERFREELDRQSSLRMAIRNGFARAQSAIIDSNLTTLISAGVLYAVGTEQVKGFAVPLFLGVAINVFTAVYAARVVFDVAEKQKWISTLKMMRLLATPNIDFWRLRHRALAASVIMIAIGMIAVVTRGAGLLDIDFTGGVSIEVVLNEPQDVAEVRSVLEKQDLQDLVVSDVHRRGEEQGKRFVINTATPPGIDANDYLAQVQGKLKDIFGNKLASNTLTFSEVQTTKAPTTNDKAQAAGPWTQAKLTFTHKIDHDTLAGLIQQAAPKANGAKEPLRVELFNATYEPGDTTPYAAWEVKLPVTPEQAKTLLSSVQEELHKVPVFPSAATVGGKVAGGTRERGVYALLGSMILIVIYLWVRFERVVFGLAAVLALVHDVLVTVGFLALSAYLAPFLGFLMVTPFKIGLTELAAILTLVGYSVNDTVVIFDRIREVKGKSPRITPEMINLSVNQTLSRTLLTALTVLLVVVVLYILGGPTIHAFAFALVIGSFAGSYSTIFIAAPVLLWGRSEGTAAKAKETRLSQAS
jgi:SecD/SecF fusion protein